MIAKLSREDGHGGAALTSLLGVGAGAAIVIAFAADSDIAGIIGGVLTGIASSSESRRRTPDAPRLPAPR